MNTPRGTSTPHDCEDLRSFEDIRNLKSDYFRHVDAKRWSSLRALFHADARFRGFPFAADDADGFIGGVSGFLEGVESVHQGFMPRLAVTGDGGIRGIWSMHDYLVWARDSRPYRGASIPGLYGIRGYGLYEEEYRRLDGQWRIAAMRLVRTRVDLLVGEPLQLPGQEFGAPDPDWMPRT
ncbi:hypothetical protein SRABI26_02745 [Arthrobacter sp. Bi26]|uniref:nuclear transport factor 2 family protein n=1 Tax=Arthrobacter sp. Bi26 TaxID=2822350 RepID=UPI001D34EB0D|nr:nuclear transport factor 2 family protein [Arthrobacter sp. Bi26]CAH0234883.1 hypothetical protein SRABI26_02745 [Arthrobacter sp. Bi26]